MRSDPIVIIGYPDKSGKYPDEIRPEAQNKTIHKILRMDNITCILKLLNYRTNRNDIATIKNVIRLQFD